MTATTSTSHVRRVLAIAGFAWVEARRTRLLWIALILACLLLAGSAFARSLAVTEGARLQIAFLAAAARLSAVFVACLYVLASMLREVQDKGTDLMLSLDLPRAAYLLGKAGGYGGVSATLCVILWLPIVFLAPFGPAVAWLLSLVLETWIVVAAALFCAVTLNQLMPGATFVLAFYGLCRALSSILLMATASPFNRTAWTDDLLRAGIKAAYHVLPGLDRFSQTGWLTDAPPSALQVGGLGVEAALYVTVLLGAALVDLYRKNS